MSFTSLNGFKQVHGFRDPLTRERQRLVSLFAVRSPASSPLTPFGGTSFTAHNIPRLCRGEARPAADSELVRSRRTPLLPCAFRCTTAETAAGVDTGFGRNGFNGLPIHRLASLWPPGAPPDPAPFGPQLEDCGRLGIRAGGHCRQRWRHSPPALRRVCAYAQEQCCNPVRNGRGCRGFKERTYEKSSYCCRRASHGKERNHQ